MSALKKAVHVLHQKRNELERDIERINYVLNTLGNLSNGNKHPHPRKHHRSATVRANMAAAQRARWAKLKKAA